jgi:hypothetical protein
MNKITYTRADLERNAKAYNKYLSIEFLTGLSWHELLCFCHPSLRDEINNFGKLII